MEKEDNFVSKSRDNDPSPVTGLTKSDTTLSSDDIYVPDGLDIDLEGEDDFLSSSSDDGGLRMSYRTGPFRRAGRKKGMRHLSRVDGNSSSQNRSIYEICRIDPEAEMRLIQIGENKTPDEEIEVDVMYGDPDSQPYIAVSYTWGSAELVKTISCSGILVNFTANCYDVLLAFRNYNESLPVWIDAICINQADVYERNAQVSHMSDILYSALRVIGYPGRPFLSRLEKIKSVTDKSEPSGTSARAGNTVRTARADSYTVPVHEVMAHHPEALVELFKSPWFSRTWVVQEIMLANRLYVFLDSKSFISPNVQPMSTGWPLVLSMRQQVFLEYGRAKSTVSHMNLKYWRLFEMMESTRHFVCRDPRDKLFAMLSVFVQPIPRLLRPDYSKPVQEVYADLSWFLISDENRQALSLAGTFQAGDGMPSWVTNWACQSNATPLSKGDFLVPPTMWQAGWSDSFQSVFAKRDGLTVIIRGVVLSKLTVVKDGSSAQDGPFDLPFDPDRKAFDTNGGFKGFGWQVIAAEDYLCILLGFPTPFIVRETPHGWLLIGECYVKSVMLGQVVRNLDVSKADSKSAVPPFQDFKIY